MYDPSWNESQPTTANVKHISRQILVPGLSALYLVALLHFLTSKRL